MTDIYMLTIITPSLGLGLASHLGVLSGIPCIGVAKKLFNVDGLSKSPEFKYKVITIIRRLFILDLVTLGKQTVEER